jgi:hypothetical protein
VQCPPYNQIQFKTTVNKFAVAEVSCPFVLGVLLLMQGRLVGVVLIGPSIYFAVQKILAKQIFVSPTLQHARI